MQLTLVTRADSFFVAQRNGIDELECWKESQAKMGRTDFPWLDQAIAYMEGEPYAQIIGMYADPLSKVIVSWYDEREK
jgi:hypothetical protein